MLLHPSRATSILIPQLNNNDYHLILSIVYRRKYDYISSLPHSTSCVEMKVLILFGVLLHLNPLKLPREVLV